MSGVLWSGAEIAAATQGRLVGGNFNVTGISIDTRTLQPGDLFIALRGPHHDGHDHIQAALQNGAAGVLSQKPCDRGVVVTDTFRALHDLGAAGRERSNARIIAVTGSVGKTSVKAMLAVALSAVGATHAAEASLNNHWGVPLSLARMPADAAYAVLEIGMNHAGEISPLSKLTAPHVGIITTIAAAHIAHLGSLENIALAKAELFDGMAADGIAILPRDTDQFPILLAGARTQGLQQIITFGKHADADIRLLQVEKGHLQFIFHEQEYACNFGLPGEHQAVNFLAVIAAIASLGVAIETVLPIFAVMRPVAGRGDTQIIAWGHGQSPITVIDETHNASPIAVEAALRALPDGAGRRIVVLGDMLELGPDAAAMHAGLADAVRQAKPDGVLLCGPLMASLVQVLGNNMHAVHYADSATLAAQIGDMVRPGDTIMVKGSRGSKMKLIIDALMRLGQFGGASQDARSPASLQIG